MTDQILGQQGHEREEWGFWKRLRRRKLRNYLFLDKRLQFNFALLVALICATNALFFTGLMYFHSQESFIRLAVRIPDYALTEDVFKENYELYIQAILFIGLFQLIMFPLLGMFFSHRIAGPLFNISNKLKVIAKGEIPPLVRLRRHDLLTQFANQFNETVSALAQQRLELEEALKEMDSGHAEEGKKRLQKLTQPEPPPESA